MGISNREWLYSLDVADLAEWFDAEHVDDAISENLGLSQDSEIDSRKKLENDILTNLSDTNGYIDPQLAFDWLDRQAAITERQYKENYTGLGLLHDLNEYGISVKYLPSERRFTFDCPGCEWPSLAAQPDQEAYDRIAELQAKVTELQIQLEAMSDVANDYRFERDEMQERVDTLTRYIHEIKQIARKV